jgi:hypothetical protein
MSVFQLLVMGKEKDISLFHSSLSSVLVRTKHVSDQSIYSCFDAHFDMAKEVAKNHGLELFQWDSDKKQWNLIVTKPKPQTSRATD